MSGIAGRTSVVANIDAAATPRMTTPCPTTEITVGATVASWKG
jgi:hypothetical protein